MQRIFVTGLGTISSIGLTVKESYESLLSLKTGIRTIRLLDTALKENFPAGEVALYDNELKVLAEVKSNKVYSRTALLGMIAAKEALKNAGIENVDECPTGLFGSTSVGGMNKGEVFYKDYFFDKKSDSLDYARVHDCGESTQCIASHLDITDYVTTISTACSSSANAIMQGARMIKAGLLDRAVVGGADALTIFTLNGFNSLMILSDELCKPFDQNRKGLNLGEGAGYLVLESEASVKKHGKIPLAEISGYGNACDAFHQTASSAEGIGAGLAMKQALDVAGLKPKDIDYINVHGTGTGNNDLSEGHAMLRLFESKVPGFSSTKSFTGHTLGAAGGIEAVFSVLAIQNNIVFPNLNFKDVITELGIKPMTQLGQNKNINHVLSNSFGFGGNNTSLLFSKC